MELFNKVLLVDDNSASNFLSILALEGYDFSHLNSITEIIVKESKEDAWEFIKHHCCGEDKTYQYLILADLNIAIANGPDFLSELKAGINIDLSHTKVAILTSLADPITRKYLEDLGIKKIVRKPLTQEKISILIKSFEMDNASF